MRTTAAFLLVCGALAGCNESTLGVRVVAADGGDPFLPPDAATQARFRIENGTLDPVTVNVSSSGEFSLTATVDRSTVASRGVLEALRGGEVVGGGATPPMGWIGLNAGFVKVFVQRRDSVVESPWQLRYARIAPMLFEVQPTFVVTLGGTPQAQPIETFNELSLFSASDGAPWDITFGADASFVRLGDGRILAVRGCAALVWNPSTNATPTMPTAMPPMERCDITQSTVVQEPNGGGLLFGGRRGTDAVARVDIVMPDGTWMTSLPMAAARARPTVVRTGQLEALVAGGQAMGTPFLERYTRTLEADRRFLRTGVTSIDERGSATLVDADSGVVLLLGGSVLGSTDLTADDAVLDTRCFNGGCPVVVGTPRLLRERRRDAAAALAEGNRVVVASGAAAGGVASSVEVIDVTNPRAPTSVGPVATLPYDNLTAIRLRTGSVLFAGGNSTTTWLYRH